jgi:mannose-6-phosphate isomerase-like protein (cupin superfamily)
VDDIPIPPFPRPGTWVNIKTLRTDELRGRPVLVEFWDFCRPNSIRTLPYLRAWDQRYDELRVVGVHSSGFAPSADPAAVKGAVARLEIEYAVIVDTTLAIWQEYDNLGWPARYLFDERGMLFDYHFGEGAYAETEAAIQSLLKVSGPVMEPVRPEDADGASLVVQSDDVAGAYSGPYEAGEVWAVLEGTGTVTANDQTIEVDHPGAYRLLRHEYSTPGTLSLQVGEGVVCHATCFAPGLAS